MSNPSIFQIDYQGQSIECRSDETILEAMLRQGIRFPFSCRKGSCHACTHVAISGEITEVSQKGLDAQQIKQGKFLPCLCIPVGDMSIVPPNSPEASLVAQQSAQQEKPLSPDPEMWEALQEGTLLTAILEDFYTRAYEDERLAPFFHGVTMQRAIEKQYSFLRQHFTGEKIYFGDRPKNAHHWMVISDELFDYRESIMVGCLKRQGLPDHLIERWRALENSFRSDIVKDKPWNRQMGDTEIPAEGFDDMVMDVGSLCDSCGREIDAGVQVRYHLRLGSIYCPDCMGKCSKVA